MMHCGLLGQKLSHSYSPAIHSMLGDYEYKLYETEPENVETFLRKGDFDALNVTIPYKKCAAAICDELSETARAIGSVNTIVRRADGTLYGDNTDVYGFEELLRRAVFSPRAKKVLVLGSGGASAAVVYALEKQQAREIVVVSRDGKDNYSNLSRHTDAELIVNTTPVGMYPHNGEAVIDLLRFPHCRAVVDLIYNPVRTELLLQAEKLGIPCANGMVMLAAQAIRASEIFTGKKAASGALEHAIDLVKSKTMNIVLIGMPGCGKSAVAEALGKALGREVLDTDAYIEEHTGYTPEQIITMQGESVFRTHESEAVRELGSAFGAIVATGGGAVLHEENYAPLHQNGVIFWLRRDLDKLERDGRPLALLGGRGYYSQSVAPGDDIAAGITRAAAEAACGVRAPFAVGVLHTGLDIDPTKAPADPRQLAAAGMDYWALGHIHEARLDDAADPRIAFSGCIQGRDINETGARGCLAVTLEEGKANRAEFVPLASVVWQKLDVDVSACTTIADVHDAIMRALFAANGAAQCEEMVERVTLVGTTPLHGLLADAGVLGDLRDEVNEGYPVFFCDALIDRTRAPHDRAALKREGLFPQVLLEQADLAASDEPGAVAYLQDEFLKAGLQLPAHVIRGVGSLQRQATDALLDELDGGSDER